MWKLIKVPKTEWMPDNSGYYTLINWINDNTVRLDVMDKDNMPVVSFQGAASDVRKHIMQYLDSEMQYSESEMNWQTLDWFRISCEHASYIGAELARCELLKTDYVQD